METATITPEQAAQRLRAAGMRINPDTVRKGMEQRRFPFGDYIKTEKSCICYVYPRLLEQWIWERFGNGNAQKPPPMIRTSRTAGQRATIRYTLIIEG